MLVTVFIFLLIIICVNLYLKNTESFVNPIDKDEILGEQYFEYKNLKNEDKFSKYLENRNRKYENMFKGSVLNKYYNLVNLNF